MSIAILGKSLEEINKEFKLDSLGCDVDIIDIQTLDLEISLLCKYDVAIFYNIGNLDSFFLETITVAIKQCNRVILISSVLPSYDFSKNIYKLVDEAKNKFNFILYPSIYYELIKLLRLHYSDMKIDFIKVQLNKHLYNIDGIEFFVGYDFILLFIKSYFNIDKIVNLYEENYAHDNTKFKIWSSKTISFSDKKKINIEYLLSPDNTYGCNFFMYSIHKTTIINISNKGLSVFEKRADSIKIIENGKGDSKTKLGISMYVEEIIKNVNFDDHDVVLNEFDILKLSKFIDNFDFR